MAAQLGESNKWFTIGERPVSESTRSDNMGSQTSCSSWDLAIVFFCSICEEVDVLKRRSDDKRELTKL